VGDVGLADPRRELLVELPREIDGQGREVGDEVQRILDLVRDAGREPIENTVPAPQE